MRIFEGVLRDGCYSDETENRVFSRVRRDGATGIDCPGAAVPFEDGDTEQRGRGERGFRGEAHRGVGDAGTDTEPKGEEGDDGLPLRLCSTAESEARPAPRAPPAPEQGVEDDGELASPSPCSERRDVDGGVGWTARP